MILDSFTIKHPFIDTTPDTVIIGSGPGGAACAYRVAMAGKKVYLLEEGWHHSYTYHGRDEAFALIHFYRDGGLTAAMGDPPIPVLMGRTLGGASRINQACALRMPQKHRKKWIKAGLGWAEKKLDEYYDDIEQLLKVGPVPENMLNRNGEIFMEAMKAAGGTPELMRRNAPGCDGCGTCITGCPTFKKRSTDMTFIPEGLKNGLTVFCGAKATEVKERNGRVHVKGQLIDQYGSPISYFHISARTVVISCGALFTPLLLFMSDHPDPHGRIGKGFYTHPTAIVFGIHEETVDGFDGIPMQGYCDSFFEETGCVIESMFLLPVTTSVALPGTPAEHLQLMKRYRHMSMFIVQRYDSHSGFITHWADRPFPFYNLAPDDETGIVRGVAICARGLLRSGAKEVVILASGGIRYRREKEINEHTISFRKGKGFIYSAHPQGTCCAGENPERYPVRPDLSLRYSERIFVADTSIFPYPTGVNPMLTAMAAGYHAAEGVLAIL